MPDWTALRSHFPVARQWAFLDHAAVAPLPDVAGQALHDYARSLMDHGIASIAAWGDRLKQVRQLSAKVINANVEDVCFIPNTTFGVGMIAEGFPWQPGDNVITAAEEYPTNQYPWMNLASRGVEVRSIPSRGNRISIDDIRSVMDDKTKVLALSAIEFASGFRNNLPLLGELCRSRGVFFFVDAIQMLGMMPFDVQQLPVDALSADGHKWLLGPEGAGIAWVRREWVDRLRPVMVGWNSVKQPFDFNTINLDYKPHAGRWEGGASNVPGLTAMGASIELLLSVGLDNVWSRIANLTDYLCDRAPHSGLEVFSSREANEKSGIVSLTKPGVDPASVMKTCRAAGVIVNNRHNRLRVSPHAWNSFEDIDRFLDSVR
ncbi:aminotransferase class V-fold PLP-dependent enzyme [soil metagenome]